MTGKINNLQYLKVKRKTLRANLTPAEAALWTLLKGRKIGDKKFRRHHSVGNYILDFYCPEMKLAIELDGAGHYTPDGIAYDETRSKFLAEYGIKVIRFENKVVFERTDWMIEEIKNNLK